MGTFITVLLFMGLVLAEVWYIINILGFGKHGQVKKFDSVEGGREVIFPAHDTDNPWLQRVFASPAYGQVPKHIKELLHRVSADENEKVIGSVWTMHGKWKMGYLVATTNYLRWVQTFPWNDDEFWQYNVTPEVTQVLHKKILTVLDQNFQVRGLHKAGDFNKMYKNLQQGLLHEDRQEAERTTSGGDAISAELQRLADMYKQSLITMEEFQSAKQRLLGPSHPHESTGHPHAGAKQKRMV